MTVRWVILSSLIGSALLASALLADGTTAPPATPNATTQPVMQGRDTPEGAMNVYEQALARGDLATVADSWNARTARSPAFAKMMILDYRFQRGLASHFSPADVDRICKECQLGAQPTSRPYVAADWDQNPPPEPGVVYAKRREVMAPMMQRCADGIWRMGRVSRRPPVMTPQMAARLADMEQRQQRTSAETEQRFTPVIANLQAGKYAIADDVISALYPEGSPMEKIRRIQARENADEAQQEAAQKQQLLVQHFDPSTVEGAIGSFKQACEKHDRPGIARFFYAVGDDDARLANANAHRILIASALSDAMRKQFGATAGENMEGRFALLIDAPEWFAPTEVHADTVVAQSPGTKKMHFRKIAGIWKEDITNSTPAAKRADKMEQTNAVAEKIIADVLTGKYKTPTEVDQAIKKANLDETYHELEPEE
jgi:hypothetical protein